MNKLGASARYGRADRSALGRWFWEVDKVLMLLIAVLIGFGLIAVAAASPAAAQRYSGANLQFPELYYFTRQLFWIALSVPLIVLISMLDRKTALRMSLIGGAITLFLLALVPLVGFERNGAQR